ncbi:hypothetical protein QE152_g38690 [Popillia japonica]|uniref:Uncharacterized protein n=1 Tax=Popillia japonica TaxID=7064 RepID=A0AAW1HWX0_POPJA
MSLDSLVCSAVKKLDQRFNDWKNSTRAKYRKIVEDSKQTSAGPKIDIKLSQFEDRGLAVWGKVAVTGTARTELLFANDIAGSDATNIQSTSVNDDETPTNNKESVPAATNQKKKKKTEKSLKNIGEELLNSYRNNMTTNEWSKELEYKKLELETEKSLKNIGEELLNSYRNNMTTNEWSKELEYKKLELEKRRLDVLFSLTS